ncbi:MAG TPA: dockerin type I domain-containing protein [Candidatus Binatia bacterium]|nr:dockerin type I domain-containing protein [Candidatus Binatia bacterium]
MDRHPELLDLEAVRTGEGSAQDARHVQTCADCQAELAELTRLASAAAAMHDEALVVPAEVDARILWHARKRALAARRRPPSWPRRTALVAAAAILVAAGVTLRTVQKGAVPANVDTRAADRLASAPPPPSPERHAQPAQAMARAQRHEAMDDERAATDVNGDGSFDILDAFALARALPAPAPSGDINGDGTADRRDVDEVARRAVSLVQG